LARLKAENEQLQAYLEENKKTILKKAKDEAREIIRNANKLVENTISDIKASQADKHKTKQLRRQLEVELNKHTDQPAASVSKSKQNVPQGVSIEVGDWVKIPDTGSEAEVIGLSKNNLVLAMGELRMVKKRSEVEPVAKRNVAKASRKTYHASVSEDVANFKPEVDVRGMRTEAALNEIEKHLDKAVMMGFPSLKIIHGKGDGILRRFIRDYLRKYGEVERLEDEHPDRGGEGITYAYLS